MLDEIFADRGNPNILGVLSIEPTLPSRRINEALIEGAGDSRANVFIAGVNMILGYSVQHLYHS